MSTIHLLKAFDKSQLFRFFVDGRFQRKYRGWVGYEEGEPGSVQAMLDGYAFMLDNFELTGSLRGVYLLDLHKVCMRGVRTKNQKSAPGDIRHLNSGMPFFAKTTTLENLREVLDIRRGDQTSVFNTKLFARRAEELDAEEIHRFIVREGKVNFRSWYPNLDEPTKAALEKRGTLEDFYKAKHFVQMQFARRIEEILDRFNRTVTIAVTDDQRLRAIALVVRELELLHPFADGNCRAFACILLMQLLLTHNFPPAILANPNLDAECSLEQWIDEIRKGMSKTFELLEDRTRTVFNYSISDADPAHIAKFDKMAEELANKIDQLAVTPLTAARERVDKLVSAGSEPVM
jgi:hypothetical protein